MSASYDRHKRPVVFAGILFFTVFLAGCSRTSSEKSRAVTVGYQVSPLLSHLYVYEESASREDKPRLERFSTSADIGYALLAGSVDAGFLDREKVLALGGMPGFERLHVTGLVSFPYGSTLVTRKGVNLRLSDLPGRKIAVSSPLCELLGAFREDAERLGVNVDSIVFEYLPFDAMIPALEAGTVDGAIFKGSYSAVAQGLGHQVLYQNWDVAAGDECCPEILAQLEYLLVIREESEAAHTFSERLLATGPYDADRLRAASAKRTKVPLSVLENLPVSEIGPVDEELLEILGAHDHDHEE